MRAIVLLCGLLFAVACTNPPYRGKDVLGADDFVMDSYKIREGKFAILDMEGRYFTELDPKLLEEYKDALHEDDVLDIALYHPTREDLIASVATISASIGFPVREGSVHLPDLGAVAVVGLTMEEAREKIRTRYAEQIRDVDVFLAYKERPDRKVELAGLVHSPYIPVNGKVRLFDVLSQAQVPPEANLFKSYMIRDNALLPVDLYKLVKEGDMSQNVVMRGGDKIYIAENAASSLMVLGEVGKEQVIPLPNGFMTLRHAIAAAGGIPFTGDKSFIQVIRGNILRPKIYTLNWEHVIHLPSDSMLLMPGDIVYVAATPITEWNRFISQLLPTFVAIDLVNKGIKSLGINIDQ
jgi:polysaccharide export outer membrane protein